MTDLDPLLREAMSSVPGPVNTMPSLSDVRRRVRRHNRRRATAMVGAVGVPSLLGVALLLRHQGSVTGTAAGADPTETLLNVDGSVAFPARCAGAPTSADGQWSYYDQCVISRDDLESYLALLQMNRLNGIVDAPVGTAGGANTFPADTAPASTSPVTCDTVFVDNTTPIATSSVTEVPATSPGFCHG